MTHALRTLLLVRDSGARRVRTARAGGVGCRLCRRRAQAGRWRDSYALWQHAIDVNPRSAIAHGNLGVAILNDGDATAALPHLRKAAEFDPTDAFAHLNLTRAYLTTGDTAAAAQSALDLAGAYRRRSDFDPQLTAAVLEKFAAALEQRGDRASAARLRDAAKRLQ